MPTYPLTKSQLAAATTEAALAFVKSPTLVARRLGEILDAQQFIGLSLLAGRYTIQGGAIAVPKNEVLRPDRTAEEVAPGAEYKLTPLSREQYDLYTSSKRGIATEVTDEEIGRSKQQPVEDAIQFLKNELVFDSEALAMGVIASKVSNTIAAGAAWTGGGKGTQIVRDALRAKAQVQGLKLGYNLDTVVLLAEDWAVVVADLLPMLPQNDTSILTGDFPTILGFTWIPTFDTSFANPMILDRARLGGVARETIPSPEYRPVGGDTGVEVASIREARADKTRIQARNPHVPVVVNPAAGVSITGTGL